MRAARDDMDGGIVVIGNAPTALLEVIRMIREGIARPALVIGIPVGFISAAESKAELARTDTEYITNIGRKGGSPSAAAMLNALLRLARESPP
jgi:precorrin-8X/cobalt-precorrin-8 methylmutase